ncbi:MAG: hypothetical protein ABL870_10685 [Sediminibacterium sp.]
MHNEKPNNALSEKLDGMNSLPEGFGFSDTRVWDQLEQQLQDKKRKPMLWLRYAAAIVLLAGAAIFWILQKEVATPTDSFTKQSTEQTPVNHQSPIKIEAPKKTEAPELIAKQQITVTKNDLVSNQTEPTTIAMVPTTIPVETSPIKDTAQRVETIAAANISPVIASKPANKSAVVRKRYPVIHLYDLYKEPEPSYTKTSTKKQITEESEENLINTQESNRTWWLSKPKPVIITTSLTDNQ